MGVSRPVVVLALLFLATVLMSVHEGGVVVIVLVVVGAVLELTERTAGVVMGDVVVVVAVDGRRVRVLVLDVAYNALVCRLQGAPPRVR